MTIHSSAIGVIRKLARTALLVVVVGIASLMTATTAEAQFGMSGGMGDATQTISSRSVDGYGRILELSEDQQTAARALLDAYQSSTRALTERFQKDMKSLQAELMETQDMAEFQKQIGEKAKAMGAEGKAIESGFFDDFKSMLDASQLEKWPELERFRRRETMLRFGMVSGAGVDLLAALQRAKIDPKASVELSDIATRYESDMDQLLVVMERDQKSQQDRMLEGQGAFDMEKIQAMMKEMAESAIRVRDLNRETNRKLMAAVPADRLEAYTNEFNRRSFPRVYRTSHTSKLLKAAGGFGDLTETQKADIDRIREDYTRHSATANEKWAKAIEVQEEVAGGTIMAMMNGFSGQGGDPAVNDARKARRELDKQTDEKLRAVLNADQVSRLPEPAELKDGGMGAFFGIDDEDESE